MSAGVVVVVVAAVSCVEAVVNQDKNKGLKKTKVCKSDVVGEEVPCR